MSELQPGADLDELIATKIMGLEVVGRHICTQLLYVRDCGCALDLDEEKILGHYWTCLAPVPKYSADTGIAIDQVVEKLKPNWFVDIANDADGWEVSFLCKGSNHVYAESESLAHAICLAALECHTGDKAK